MRTLHFTAALSILSILSLVGSGCSKDSSSPSNPYGSSYTAPPPPAAAPNTVQMKNMTFSPVTITVAVGTTVTWKNNDGYNHTSTSDTGVWNTGDVVSGGSKTVTFNTAGTYPYHCFYHGSMGMRGTVVVQ